MYKRKRYFIDGSSKSNKVLSSLKHPIYIYQTYDYYPYHCGPFALYNLLKSYNKHIRLNKLIDMCNPEAKDGTSIKLMNLAIDYTNNKFNISIKSIEPTISNIKLIMSLGGKIIILFHWTHHWQKGEHYAMIEKMNSSYNFKFINYSFDEPVKNVSLRELKNMLRYHMVNNDICPAMWFAQ